MSFTARRSKPRISRVRSSHSVHSQPVKITRCPDVPEASSVFLDDVNLSSAPQMSSDRRKSVKKTSTKPSTPNVKMQRSGRPPSSRDIPDEPALLTDDFLEEMKAGLDEMGEKLKHVERELTKKKTSAGGRVPLKPVKKQVHSFNPKGRPSLAGYNPIDFTDLDFGVSVAVNSDDSRNSDMIGDFTGGGDGGFGSEEAVENVIAKIRNDIRKWRRAKGIAEAPIDIAAQAQSVSSNSRGEIVVREAAERETPCESNRSSDGLTKVHSDSLSSDPPSHGGLRQNHHVPSKNSKSSLSEPVHPLDSDLRRNGDTTSSTLSNSIPGIRQRGPRYPLDKYLPKALKREETFIKTREPALLRDVNLFRKIESLLKESEQIRDPILQQGNARFHPPPFAQNTPNENNISTEDLVAAEFYKATYGTLKNPESPVKTCDAASLVNKDVEKSSNDRHTDQEAGNRDEACALASPIFHPEEAAHVSHSKPAEGKRQERLFEYSSTLKYVQDGCELDLRKQPEPSERSSLRLEKKIARLRMSETCSVSSSPSVSLQSNRNKKVQSPVKKVETTNAGINTDRVNTHVLSIKHTENDIANDFASSGRAKLFVVQELPRVNIRGRLVKQNCGFVNINPVHVPNEIRNTAVVEVNYCNNSSDAADGRDDQVHRQVDQKLNLNPRNVQNRVIFSDTEKTEVPPSSPGNYPKPTAAHRLAFSKGLIQQSFASSDAGQQTRSSEKPKIFDTVSHFKEKLSLEMSSGLEPIKQALNEMLSNLKEFCDIGLNDADANWNISSTSRASPFVVRERVNRMDNILNEEIRSWGFGDEGHYTLLAKAIDDLSNEIKSAVTLFQRQQTLKEQTQHFLEGSIYPPRSPKVNVPHSDPDQIQPRNETLRIDKLYAIHSFLQRSSGDSKRRPEVYLGQETNIGQGDAPVQQILNETFTLDESPSNEANLRRDGSQEGIPSPRLVAGESDEDEIPGDYEEDFNPEDSEHLSENDSNPRTSNRCDKSLSDGRYSHKTGSGLNTVHMKTSGSANGEDSTDAPIIRVPNEEAASSIASTINVSQMNAATKKSIPPRSAVLPNARLISPMAECIDDKPTVRLTNKNTNAVFELRLPESLENLNSTITYNSAGYNDEIKLSIGRPALQMNNLNLQGASHMSRVQPIEESPEENLAQPLSRLNDAFETKRTGEITDNKVPTSQPLKYQNQCTQFPLDKTENIGEVANNFSNALEGKSAAGGDKLLLNRENCKDSSVQVSICRENETYCLQQASSVEVTPVHGDSYNSHTKHLERPSGSLKFSRHIENEIERTLDNNRAYPVRMESSLSSISVPTSMSELPFKSGSSSSSDLAYPLDRLPNESPFEPRELLRLQPAPNFKDDLVNFEDLRTCISENIETDRFGREDEVADPVISAHLLPRPETVLGGNIEGQTDPIPVKTADDFENSASCMPKTQDSAKITQVVLDVQPYDSDLMSEGEVGYVYTSNSYSSGEIIERNIVEVQNEESAVGNDVANLNEKQSPKEGDDQNDEETTSDSTTTSET